MDKGEQMQKVLTDYDITYTYRSGWQSIHCPNKAIHEDRNPSARVNIDEGAFICHACLLKGDAYSIVMEVEQVDFKQAMELLGKPSVVVESDYLI